MEQPAITILCDRPNNGYLALVFTDDGSILSSRCKMSDAYAGLVCAVSDLILDCAEQECPAPDAEAMTDDSKEARQKTEKWLEEILDASSEFMSEVLSKLSVSITAKKLIATGVPEDAAPFLAEVMTKAAELKHRQETSDKEKEESEDD